MSVIARHEAISLFVFLAFDNRDRHAPLAMTQLLVIAIGLICQRPLEGLRYY